MNCFRACLSILLLALETRIRGRGIRWRVSVERWRKSPPLPVIPFAEPVNGWPARLDRAS
jgi:hypothetical protein